MGIGGWRLTSRGQYPAQSQSGGRPFSTAGYAQYRSQPPALPFPQAAERLQKTVQDSLQFYQQLLQSFEQDTQAIRSYVGNEMLSQIWMLKVAPASRDSPRRQSYFEHREPMPATQARKNTSQRSNFWHLGRKLLQDMHGVVGADPSCLARESAGLVEDRKRAMRKVHTATAECKTLLNEVVRDRTKMPTLMKELDLVLKMLDGCRTEGGGFGTKAESYDQDGYEGVDIEDEGEWQDVPY